VSLPLPVLATIVGAALVQASHAVVYAFSSLHWQSKGFSAVAIGGLWSQGVIAEVCLFIIAGRYLRGLSGAKILLVAGALAAIIRWTAMAFDPPFAALVALQSLHAFTFAATHLGSVFLLSLLAPEAFQAQAQGWLAALWAGIMALLTSLAGFLLPTWGEGTYFVMAAVAASGLAFLLFAVTRASAEPTSR
jgi:PPP family 3-phenylpropionic acid transporter